MSNQEAERPRWELSPRAAHLLGALIVAAVPAGACYVVLRSSLWTIPKILIGGFFAIWLLVGLAVVLRAIRLLSR